MGAEALGMAEITEEAADALLRGVDALEYMLTASIMPDDFDVEALAKFGPEEAAGCALSEDFQDRMWGFVAAALPLFVQTQQDKKLRSGEFAFEHQQLHPQFLQAVESEMEKVLAAEDWKPDQFHTALTSVLKENDPTTGQSRVGSAAATELLRLLDGVTSFEKWADSMKG